MAMTNAERQKKYRDKIVKQLLEQSLEDVEREEKKIKERCCDMIYLLGGSNTLYAMEALLYCLTKWSHRETQEQMKNKIINMTGFAKACVDFDQEIIDGWGGEE